jgi:hypothetical protein
METNKSYVNVLEKLKCRTNKGRVGGGAREKITEY